MKEGSSRVLLVRWRERNGRAVKSLDRTRILRRDLCGEPRAFDGRTDRALFCFHFAALKTGRNLDVPKGSEWRAASRHRHRPAETRVHVSFVSVIETFRLVHTLYSLVYFYRASARERTSQEGKCTSFVFLLVSRFFFW